MSILLKICRFWFPNVVFGHFLPKNMFFFHKKCENAFLATVMSIYDPKGCNFGFWCSFKSVLRKKCEKNILVKFRPNILVFRSKI